MTNDFEGKRYCGNCFNFKDISQFGLEKKTKNNKVYVKAYCLSCSSEIESRRHLEKKLASNPTKYWECDNCDHVISIKHTACPKCNACRDEYGFFPHIDNPHTV